MSNNTTTQKTTFWNFLENHTLEIPIIQRDYAQGRKGKEELRKTFLGNLKAALDAENADSNKKQELTLDFVYGSKENDRLNPLDGQQRLTTLWLLHWYVAYKADKQTDEGVSDRFKKFTYETRVSSREFCEHLAEFNTTKPDDFKVTISDFIQQQTWFYSAWKQDPTIQSMLRMLDDLEGTFSNTDSKLWDLLTSDNCPISFYYLDLGELKLTDDLYIKMNARGEQLTSFENFKADLIGYIREQNLLDAKNGIPIKMDTIWTDIFWKNQTADGKIDDIYFAFLNRFFFNELFIAKTAEQYILNTDQENENKTYKYLNDDFKIAYSGLDIYKFDKGSIPQGLFEKLQRILDRYASYQKKNTIPKCEWDDSFQFIPKYEEIENNAGVKIKKITTLNQVQRIVFFAVCKYFSEEENSCDNEISLKQWMRVVWNLVSGEDNNGRPQIRSTSAMRTAIEFIGKLDSHDVYGSLARYPGQLTDSDFDLRCKEEIEKAKQILDDKKQLQPYSGTIKEFKDKTWEYVIITAENYAFFKGSIRFLFRNDKGEPKWNDGDLKIFDTKFENAKKYFNQDGIKEDYKVAITTDLVIQCNDWNNQLYDKQIFNPNTATWKWILCANNWILPIHNILLDSFVKTKSMNDDNVNNNILPIIENIPFKEIINKIPEGRFRWNYRLAIYKPYGHDVIVFDWNNWHRNAILYKAVTDKNITTDQKIDGCGFFWGWNIKFTYKNDGTDYHFEWNTDGNIYLMDDKWNRIKNVNGDVKIDTRDITTNKDFSDALNNLVSHEPSQEQTLG